MRSRESADLNINTLRFCLFLSKPAPGDPGSVYTTLGIALGSKTSLLCPAKISATSDPDEKQYGLGLRQRYLLSRIYWTRRCAFGHLPACTFISWIRVCSNPNRGVRHSTNRERKNVLDTFPSASKWTSMPIAWIDAVTFVSSHRFVKLFSTQACKGLTKSRSAGGQGRTSFRQRTLRCRARHRPVLTPCR